MGRRIHVRKIYRITIERQSVFAKSEITEKIRQRADTNTGQSTCLAFTPGARHLLWGSARAPRAHRGASPQCSGRGKVRDGGAPSPAREGACAPRISSPR